MCVYSSVRDTLTLLLSQVGRQVFTSRSSFLSTNCWVLLSWKQEKKTALNQKSWFLIYLWGMSTSHLYAHLFIDMCTMDWMLKAPEHWRLVSKLWDGSDAFPDVGLSAWPAAPPAASLDLLCCVAARLRWHPSSSQPSRKSTCVESPESWRSASSQWLCTGPHCQWGGRLSGPSTCPGSVRVSWALHYGECTIPTIGQSRHQVQSVWIWFRNLGGDSSYSIFLALPFEKKSEACIWTDVAQNQF